ncbi:MAG: sugar-binding protein, partial [Planctomycetota bacterium]|nr:sugar-binding protein [Planctomycetota bacterium]
MLYPFTILFLTIVSGEPETPPLQVISLVSKPPVIDGKLDDKAWPKIQPFSPFLISGTKTPAPIQTEVKACFDGGALYFAIVCLDPSSPKLKAKYDRRDGPLWEDDAIEIFINPDDRTYYQFILNSKGARCDLSYPKPSGGKTGLDWNAKPDWSVKTS